MFRYERLVRSVFVAQVDDVADFGGEEFLRLLHDWMLRGEVVDAACLGSTLCFSRACRIRSSGKQAETKFYVVLQEDGLDDVLCVGVEKQWKHGRRNRGLNGESVGGCCPSRVGYLVGRGLLALGCRESVGYSILDGFEIEGARR